jgi:NAD(P)-dependent dehydrogenase (short-subunit alcohol dehydrogenase family)
MSFVTHHPLTATRSTQRYSPLGELAIRFTSGDFEAAVEFDAEGFVTLSRVHRAASLNQSATVVSDPEGGTYMAAANATDRVWLITGASSGFGRALVETVRERGERVVATARRPETLADLEADTVMVHPLDVTKEEAIEPALDAAVERFGRLDVLVNNAGVGFVGALEEGTLTDLRHVMETMFFGPAALTRAVVPRMRAQGSGWIVQISSMGGQVTAPGYSAYCAAKFALEALSEAVAAEVAPFGLRLLIVEPGSFRTGLLGRSLNAAPALEEYAATVGATRAYIENEDGRQAGDPLKAARAIIDVLGSEDPPLRLALGPDAVEAIRAKHESLREDLARWESLALSTTFDEEASA